MYVDCSSTKIIMIYSFYVSFHIKRHLHNLYIYKLLRKNIYPIVMSYWLYYKDLLSLHFSVSQFEKWTFITFFHQQEWLEFIDVFRAFASRFCFYHCSSQTSAKCQLIQWFLSFPLSLFLSSFYHSVLPFLFIFLSFFPFLSLLH